MARILIIDDEPSIREFLSMMLSNDGLDIETAEDGKSGIQLLQTGNFDLVLTDLKMSGLSGMDVLRATKRIDPSIQVIMITAFGTTETAVEAMKSGAADYITKPFKIDELKLQVNKALQVRELQRENLYLKEKLEGREGVGQLIGNSPIMKRVFDLILRVSRTPTTVLISGESGTGKELVARAIHQKSSASKEPFVAVNCGAIPGNLIESELFGHVKGAFTGSIGDRAGVFEAAGNGTIFLDEIAELPLDMQVKLLRVLQEKKVIRVGSTKEITLNCRVVAATNKNLEEAVSEGQLREDLYYRLNVVEISLPPLRDRPEDIPLLIEHFLNKHADTAYSNVRGITQKAMNTLIGHSYDGNVRELENLIQRALALTPGDMIDINSLPVNLIQSQKEIVPTDILLPENGIDLDSTIDNLERNLLVQALTKSNGVRKEAAKILGISFRSIRYRLDKHQIDGDQFAK